VAFAAIAALLLAVSFGCDWFRDPDEWRETYDFGSAEPVCIAPAPDSGFTVCAWHYVGEDTFRRPTLMMLRCTPRGETLWTRHPLPDSYLLVDAACPGPDGSVYAVGHTQGNDAFACCCDAAGEVTWYRLIDRGYSGVYATSVCPTADGGALVACRMLTGAPAFALALSPAGDSLWVREYDHATIANVAAMCQADDGWFLAGCDTNWCGRIVRIGANGAPAWSAEVQFDSTRLTMTGIVPTADGGCVASGEGWPPALFTGIQYSVVARLNSEGRDLFAIRATEPDQWYERIISTPDGYYLVGSIRKSYRWRARVVRLDPQTLAVTGDKEFGGDRDCYGFDLACNADGSLTLAACFWPDKQLLLAGTKF
jgi:hypothetical protein